MPKKKVKVPIDTFAVFIRFPKDATKLFVASVIRGMANRKKNEKIFFLPNNVEVIVVNDKGQTKVL